VTALQFPECPKCAGPLAPPEGDSKWCWCAKCGKHVNPRDIRVKAHRGEGGLPAHLQAVRVLDVQREQVDFRWEKRLARGKLHLIEGDPGAGKSWLTLAIATAYTLGNPLPGDDSRFPPESVLLFTAEDAVGDTVKPRLEDMGADQGRVDVIRTAFNDEGVEHFPNLTEDIVLLERELAENDYGLLIVDPLNAYLRGIDGNRDIDLRSALGPIAQLAERYDVSIICVRHLTKSPATAPSTAALVASPTWEPHAWCCW
jgi:RecA-family ATPase